jgi:hypothetical protein
MVSKEMEAMTTGVKERPILFSGEMVRAILEGRKTQTRRVMKPQPTCTNYWMMWGAEVSTAREVDGDVVDEWTCPYGQSGDRLWVRETWRPVGPWECRKDSATIQYRSDGVYERKTGWSKDFRIKTDDRRDKWRPSIFMPRWASRITLEITGVRIERIQEGGDREFWGDQTWNANPWVWVIEFKRIKP